MEKKKKGRSMRKLSRKSCRAAGVLVIGNDRGLHTRPSTELVKCAASFKSEVKLSYLQMEVNAKSLLGILMLAAGKGAKISVTACGEDAKAAVQSLIDLSRNNFNICY